ncbi:MAG: nucleotide exchange factor GrpE [Deltaproteobacteria bacterium]|nr:nucleotide exchange factor GrpE [Deltaproteobacteria bacterium]MBN2687961.1 nucleotide exchange factor GrpE [Deltaproteobacteria bacterium]
MTKRATTKGKEEEKTLSGESLEKEAAVEREKKEQSDLEKDLEQMKKEAADNYDKYLRAAAEMENYKKRAVREKADAIKYGNETLIRDILPIVDSLERALDHSSNSKDFDSFVEGLNLIYGKLLGVLEKNGVEKIDAVGKDFDPHFHEAVLQVECADMDDNKVVEKFENGYLLNDRLLRPVKVSVSKHVTNERKTS